MLSNGSKEKNLRTFGSICCQQESLYAFSAGVIILIEVIQIIIQLLGGRRFRKGGGNPSRGEDVGVSLRARRGWRRLVQRPSRISGTALAWIAAAFSALRDRQHRSEMAATDTARMASADPWRFKWNWYFRYSDCKAPRN
ncbi:uncharacterized protein LOC120639835 [Panicum virgatum]|uniref:uncharacterized protein LOC120639835 n=1 Tax=Panicum virgatum TaxID=38727 RepID=UPI0019D5D44E|nr:uncharacterized protein LOC120639835 [Panicum virgatum]